MQALLRRVGLARDDASDLLRALPDARRRPLVLELGLFKTGSGHELRAEGRDIEDTELRVAFEAGDTWRWTLVGDARELKRQEADQALIEALQDGGPTWTKDLAERLGKDRSGVQRTAKRLAELGQINREQDPNTGAFTYTAKHDG